MSDTATPEKKKATRAGNYFISNYPPFSFWSEEQATEVLSAFENEPVPGTPLGLYHHIPFCRKRCHFCYFRVYTDKNADEIKDINLAKMYQLHLEHDAKASIALTTVEDPEAYGVAMLDGNKVVGFVEKPEDALGKGSARIDEFDYVDRFRVDPVEPAAVGLRTPDVRRPRAFVPAPAQTP